MKILYLVTLHLIFVMKFARIKVQNWVLSTEYGFEINRKFFFERAQHLLNLIHFLY
jgi:hypothetical protein